MISPSFSTPASPSLFENHPKGFADIVESRIDGVVNISATLRSKSTSQSDIPDMQLPEGPFGEFLRDFLSLPLKGKSRPQKITSLGSGFVIDSSGLIVTNYHVIKHVIEEKGEIRVIFNSGEELLATIVGADFRSDLALLKVNPKKPLTALKWGNSQKARVGDFVLAIGNPFGLGGTVTMGIISHTKRLLPPQVGVGEVTHVDQWIQTDAPINLGCSGGPTIDMEGNVIGINTSIYTPTGGSIGIALAIPSSVAQPIIQSLKDHGCVERGWIGIKLGSPVNEEWASALRMEQAEGVVIDDAIAGTPAEEAGIRPGDVILKINNISVSTPSQIRSLVSSIKPGETITVTLWKHKVPEGSTREVTLKVTVKRLENRYCRIPQNRPSQNRSASTQSLVLGIDLRSIQELPERTLRGMDASIRSGVLVTDIQPSSPAIDKIKPGDIIIAIGAEDVTSPRDCRRIVEQTLRNGTQKTLLFWIIRPGEGRSSVLVKIGEEASSS